MATDKPFDRRENIMASFAGSGDDVLRMRVWLDIRDLLNRISMVSNVGEVEIIEDPEVEEFMKKNEKMGGVQMPLDNLKFEVKDED